MCVWMDFNNFICASRVKAIVSNAFLLLLLHVTAVILWHLKLYSLKNTNPAGTLDMPFTPCCV